MGLKLLALIPARGGSKGIPRKNVKKICDKPLIAWSIEAAQKSKYIDKLVVSTEDKEISNIAKKYGADIPLSRPEELSRDDTLIVPVILDAIKKLPGYDWVLLLQPTSPLRTEEDIDRMIRLCYKRGVNAAVSVCLANKHPNWMYEISGHGYLKPYIDTPLISRRQELPFIYNLNGALYCANIGWLKKTGTFLTDETLAYEMPVERSVDIDNISDWKWAEYLLSKSK